MHETYAPGSGKKAQPEDILFALDIGTRTVVGVLGKWEAGRFLVLDYEQMEHSGRAMIDGQVEDIAAVGALIAAVKERLEERANMQLSRVAIAAAGRMLRTIRVRAERTLNPRAQVDNALMVGLEGEAIELAQTQMRGEREGKAENFYCVGYSITEYTVDGRALKTPVGHLCSSASVEMIAAFLPNSVVEGLYAAVDTSGLEVMSLTLEPIAAINVLIPQDLRLLNLALVDIGAGTSDIAICRGGSVASYDMATIAGDEVTEAIIDRYLVDFETAERMKRALSGGDEEMTYLDVLGLEHTVSCAEAFLEIQPAVAQLANTVAVKILENNNSVPAAVFLIGGGSLVPRLGEALSECLPLERGKIAVGARRALRAVDTSAFPALTGPEFVTPLGIAVTAATQECFHFFGVSVNGKRIKLLNAGKMRCLDVLILAGYRTNQIIGQAGHNLLFSFNGQRRVARGGLPEHAVITVNGANASIDTEIQPGDQIEISPAVQGSMTTVRVSDLLANVEEWKNLPGGTVTLSGTAYPIGLWLRANGKTVDKSYEIAQNDDILVQTVRTARELATAIGMEQTGIAFEEEGRRMGWGELLHHGMTLQVVRVPSPEETSAARDICNVTVNGRPCAVPLGEDVRVLHVMNLIEYVDIDLERPRGMVYIVVNGEESGFMREVNNGDIVEIGWK